jgi:hypothetical protein
VSTCTYGSKGWPEPYIYTVYYSIFGDLPAKFPYVHCICVVLANPRHSAATLMGGTVRRATFCQKNTNDLCRVLRTAPIIHNRTIRIGRGNPKQQAL